MTNSRPIRRLAIVNRGEAAMRCIRTVKSLRAAENSDLQVVALYTPDDREAPYVRHADAVLPLPVRSTAVAAYLDHDLLMRSLEKLGADAVWPGWGFVAESPEFVDRLGEAGIRFLGPSGDTMRRLGDKIASKQLADRLKIPVTPWSGKALESVEEALEAGKQIGLPLVLKASAGGGGRGIRMVEELARLPAQFQSARSEALGAFGDGRLFLESMVRGGRHVEVQIVADQHGFVRAIGCRDCSVQRRHQKVIEEAPPLGIPRETLTSMQDAAELLAREVRYAGVGTVEFLVEASGAFFFMEMNPRLQVEHGITEEITGLDLVELQIRIARGEDLRELAPREQGYCIEARVCAEDPRAGFLPAPGRIARFDAALGPHVRIDTGVVAGSVVPAAFDSLIAKVMARGTTRDQARSRLCAALRDFDLVIEGGATNKGYLLDVLESDAFKAGGVDTLWLDRRSLEPSSGPTHAVEALVLAGILGYRAAWGDALARFFSDTSGITPDRIPALQGCKLDFEYLGQGYQIWVFEVGPGRYRVRLGDNEVRARFGETGSLAARLLINGRYYRATYDVTLPAIRVEVEGCAHRFGRQTVGQVRAHAPSMVVAIEVAPGQRVEASQHLGLLEAMKMEIGFSAPVAGTIAEIAVSRGQQVSAGDLLLVIDASQNDAQTGSGRTRLELPSDADPLSVLFGATPRGEFGNPDLAGASAREPSVRARALQALGIAIERTMLGWDVYEPRLDSILELLSAPLPEDLDEAFLRELAELRHGLFAFANLEELFSNARNVDERNALRASNHAQLRVYLRRLRSTQRGTTPEFVQLLQTTLGHYGVDSVEYSVALEQALLRLFASQRDPAPRRRLATAVLRHVIALLDRGLALSDDHRLRDTLKRIAALRSDVGNALADTALDAHYRAYQGWDLARTVENATQGCERWLSTAPRAGESWTLPSELLETLLAAPEAAFAAVAEWVRSPDQRKRSAALSTYVHRLYAPKKPQAHRSELVDGAWIERSRFEGNLVLAVLAAPERLGETLRSLSEALSLREDVAFEVLLDCRDSRPSPEVLFEQLQPAVGDKLRVARVTLSILAPSGELHHTWIRREQRLERIELFGLHPEAAARVDLGRYCNFELERMWAPSDLYCFHAKARENPEDVRLLVLGDVRARPKGDGSNAQSFQDVFERAFREAARTLRLNRGMRDPRRLLHWNRIALHMAHPMALDSATAQRVARGLSSDASHLGIERIIVRFKLDSPEHPGAAPREIEGVSLELGASRMELTWRRPHRQPLVAATAYERKVAEARRRSLFYPYEIVRMLTSGYEARDRAVDEPLGRDRPATLPPSSFEEHDLDPESPFPRAVSVQGRQPGLNTSAVIFGIITTPTAKILEGMRRVLILSDPTRGMGALGATECDRVLAALDLAQSLALPVEWLPVSSGARIAMDSGTENLDATARVARRIVTFTQAGGVIHVLVTGINVGAQSYWNALATMLMHTQGALIMTPEGSMVLTGSAALAASGSVSAPDEVTIGGHERVMGPNGQAQYFAPDLIGAYQLLYQHYEYTYVLPGERAPRRFDTHDPSERDVREAPYASQDQPGLGTDFRSIGDLFDEAKNPGRKRPFSMRSLMGAVIDADGGHLERWGAQSGAETAIVWDAHLGGHPISLFGIEAQNVPRLGYGPSDGPEEWNGGTLFPQSSKKLARALNAANGNRPVVVLANLSGFDGSPESMRKLQLEYGAEIARAVVNFQGTIVFLVVSRYHGGAYVVFSRTLNPRLRALAVEGSYASVIGGGPAAAVVFAREVRARVAADPRIEALRASLRDDPSPEARAAFERLRRDTTLEKRAEIAAQFDAVHTVERAERVGSLEGIVSPREIRPYLIGILKHARAEILL